LSLTTPGESKENFDVNLNVAWATIPDSLCISHDESGIVASLRRCYSALQARVVRAVLHTALTKNFGFISSAKRFKCLKYT
jgi:hypothetical protein